MADNYVPFSDQKIFITEFAAKINSLSLLESLSSMHQLSQILVANIFLFQEWNQNNDSSTVQVLAFSMFKELGLSLELRIRDIANIILSRLESIFLEDKIPFFLNLFSYQQQKVQELKTNQTVFLEDENILPKDMEALLKFSELVQKVISLSFNLSPVTFISRSYLSWKY